MKFLVDQSTYRKKKQIGADFVKNLVTIVTNEVFLRLGYTNLLEWIRIRYCTVLFSLLQPLKRGEVTLFDWAIKAQEEFNYLRPAYAEAKELAEFLLDCEIK